MALTYFCNLYHLIFSTKDRLRLIHEELQPKLWAYMAGIAKNHGMNAVLFGGIEDHCHGLVSIPPVLSVSDAVKALKANSSRWMSEHKRGFAWQSGYGSFTVSRSAMAGVEAYIRNQREHHRKYSFEQEYVALLEKHGVEYDPKYIFD